MQGYSDLEVCDFDSGRMSGDRHGNLVLEGEVEHIASCGEAEVSFMDAVTTDKAALPPEQ